MVYALISYLTTEYTYDAVNRLYDENGSLVLKSCSANTSKYIWDENNRLSSVVVSNNSETSTEQYLYDYQGNRIQTTVNGTDITKYLVDTTGELSQVIAEIDENNREKAYYTLGQELISIEKDSKVCYYSYEGHGNVRVLTDQHGNVTDTYTYDAFGNLTKQTGTTDNNYLYCAQQYSTNTGLYYLRARYMNPETGTFVSRDTYSGNTNSPVTLHKYLYANANPVTYSDPSGYCGVIVEAKYVAEVAVIGFSFILMATALVGAINSMSGVMTNVITGIVDGIGSMVDSIATGIQDSAEMIESLRDQIAKEVYDLVQGLLEGTETVKDFGQGKHTVYVLIDKNTGNGEYSFTIKYVGRTVNESKREAAHKRNTEKKDYEFRAIYRGLSRNNARIFEQALISTFILGKCGGALVNKIRGIAVNKLVNFDLSSICNFYNRMENEMLDLMGQ